MYFSVINCIFAFIVNVQIPFLRLKSSFLMAISCFYVLFKAWKTVNILMFSNTYFHTYLNQETFVHLCNVTFWNITLFVSRKVWCVIWAKMKRFEITFPLIWLILLLKPEFRAADYRAMLYKKGKLVNE